MGLNPGLTDHSRKLYPLDQFMYTWELLANSFLLSSFLNEWQFISLNDYKNSYLILMIQFDINHLFAYVKCFQSLLFKISNSFSQIFLGNISNVHTAV